MNEQPTRLAFDIALKQLHSQREDLRSARNRAGMAAAISGLIAATFAGMAEPNAFLAKGELFFLFIPVDLWIVILTFTSSIYFAAQVGIAQQGCIFDLSPSWIINQHAEGVEPEVIYKLLATDCEQYFDDNEKIIQRAQNNMWWSVVLGCAQIPAWLVVLI